MHQEPDRMQSDLRDRIEAAREKADQHTWEIESSLVEARSTRMRATQLRRIAQTLRRKKSGDA